MKSFEEWLKEFDLNNHLQHMHRLDALEIVYNELTKLKTCDGCKYYKTETKYDADYCYKLDIENLGSDFGCVYWEGK